MPPLRIVVGKNHPWTRQTPDTIGRALIQIVGEARGGKEFVHHLSELRPDAVVLDTRAAEVNLLGAWTAIQGHYAEAQTLLLCLHHVEDDPGVVSSACAYLMRSADAAEISRIVREVHDRQCRYRSNGPPTSSPGRAILDHLTPREREVLAWIAQEKTSKEIAAILDISPRTVDTHRSSLMKKLGIRSLAGLVRYALNSGMPDPIENRSRRPA
jgi:DNA-binding NarL/FixJ family response regulator